MKKDILEGVWEFFGSMFWYTLAFLATLALIGLIEILYQ